MSAADTTRTRRSLLATAAALGGALVAKAFGSAAPARAANNDPVLVGNTNNGTLPTVVQSSSAANDARALVGRTTDTGVHSGTAGVWGDGKAENGAGVYGTAHTGAQSRGVVGSSLNGIGVRAVGGHTGAWGTGNNYGVRGNSASNYGVFGEGGYTGVFGSGPYGTYGSGTSAGAIGTSGPGYGLYGLGSIGVVGIGDGNGYGTWGYNADSGGYGTVGQGGYRGVYGSGGNAGVYGTSGYVGLWGNASTTSGLNYGVYAYTGSSDGYAGVFSGNVQVSGFLSKLGGGFKIDHPLEPDRRYLVHSFVEAPEMLNVYSGTVTLDGRGQGTVKLPGYFSAENKDHRYQLTSIGAPAPDLHVASKVSNNQFTIAGGAAGQEVCWQVTGVRQDAWAKTNTIQVEPMKQRADQGKFLSPEAHGAEKTKGIYHLRPEDSERLQQQPESLRTREERAG